MSRGTDYLEFVSKKIKEKYEEIRQSIRDVKQDIHQMNEYYWENYTEMDEYGYENYDNMQALKLSVDTNNENRRTAERLVKMMDSPFFGSLFFTFEGEDCPESFYIGIGNFSESRGSMPLIFDWRAPVSSLYYDYDKGEAQYEAPAGTVKGVIEAKGQYKIRGGRMLYEVENDFNVDDEILREELSKNGDVQLKNIIRTIQKEQNSIIRNRSDRYLIISGCAGSGKTSIALHRIAYLLYHDRERLKSSNVLIISPNGIFSDYIAHILPELGEEHIREMTMDLFAYRELKDCAEDCEEKFRFLERMIRMEEDCRAGKTDEEKWKAAKEIFDYKQSVEYVNELEGFILGLEDCAGDFCDIRFKKYTMKEQHIRELFFDRFGDVPVFTRIEYIYEHFIDEYETLGYKLKDEDREQIRGMFERLIKTRDIYTLYNSFLMEQGLEPLPEAEPKDRYIPYEDVYPMLYLKYRTEMQKGHRAVRHLVIDEMQDYTYLQYRILRELFDCPMTILGDAAQTMEEKERDVTKFLPGILGKGVRVIKLNRSYRNTTQIAMYADRIRHGEEITYFEREGKAVEEISIKDRRDAASDILGRLAVGNKYETAAILTLTAEDAARMAGLLSEKGCEFTLLDENSGSFKKGLTVAPFYLAKGLEFDQVFVADADKDQSLYMRYLYVSATRALHELCVYVREEQ